MPSSAFTMLPFESADSCLYTTTSSSALPETCETIFPLFFPLLFFEVTGRLTLFLLSLLFSNAMLPVVLTFLISFSPEILFVLFASLIVAGILLFIFSFSGNVFSLFKFSVTDMFGLPASFFSVASFDVSLLDDFNNSYPPHKPAINKGNINHHRSGLRFLPSLSSFASINCHAFSSKAGRLFSAACFIFSSIWSNDFLLFIKFKICFFQHLLNIGPCFRKI